MLHDFSRLGVPFAHLYTVMFLVRLRVAMGCVRDTLLRITPCMTHCHTNTVTLRSWDGRRRVLSRREPVANGTCANLREFQTRRASADLSRIRDARICCESAPRNVQPVANLFVQTLSRAFARSVANRPHAHTQNHCEYVSNARRARFTSPVSGHRHRGAGRARRGGTHARETGRTRSSGSGVCAGSGWDTLGERRAV